MKASSAPPLLAALSLCLLAAGAADPLLGQGVAEMEPRPARSQAFDLTIRNVMKGYELVGKDPEDVTWTDDSEWIYFRWLPGGREWNEERRLFRVPATGGEPEELSEAAADSLAPLVSEGDLSRDRRWRVTSVRGDLYLVDRESLDVRRLTRTTATEDSPTFSGDGTQVFFAKDDDLYALELAHGGIRQLTDIHQGPPPEEDEEAEGQRKFLEDQQEQLFRYIRREEREEQEQEAREERLKEEEPPTTYLGPRERVESLDPDPSGAHVVVSTSIPAEDDRTVIVPEWITESGYTDEIDTRTKVGDEQDRTRMGLLDVATGEITWLDLSPAGEDAGEAGQADDRPELFGATFIGWSDDGAHGLIQSVSFDYKTRWFWSVDAASGGLTLLDELHDDAWVGGPCFGDFGGGCAGWIPDSDRAYFVSEATGWAHLYSVNADGSDRRQLTSGDWEVRSVSIPEDGSGFYLHTSRTSPFDTQFYTMAFDGSGLELITSDPGEYSVTPSPDGRRLAVVASHESRPPELFVADNEPDPAMEQVTVSPTADWLSFPWIQPEIIHFRAQDGTPVPARIYRPADLGASPNHAAVVFVHGAGYLQNVSHGWSGYFREYMFNHFLAAQGYTVLDVDYRGSAGYGRDWRTAIYRWMGGADLSDQVDGAHWLVEHEGVDPDRIGIYGGSYGGFITLMALFTAGDTFTSGAALRSVTDWAAYNHWYTSRILNQPQDDPEAYEKSSPIYFAENFRSDQHLLILHGMVDTNVHFSDVVRLAQRLIELGKENWEFAPFPVENHGFVTPSSWTDEYRRIFQLMDRTIGEGLTVEKPMGAAAGMGGGR